MFGVLSASGTNKDYYSKCTADIVPTGAGSVYVKYNEQGKGSTNSAESGKDSQSSAPTHKYYLTAEENEGYTFVGWSEEQSATNFTYTSKTNQEVSFTAAEGESNAATKNFYAHYRYLIAAESSLDLGNTPVAGSPISKTMNVNFGHLTSTTISGNCTDSRFTLAIPEANNSCSGTVGVSITFTPTEEDEAGTYSGTVTLTCGEESTSFSISATETQATITSIKWDQSFTNLLSINNPEDITLDATVVDPQGNPIDGATVSYSSEDNNVVSIISGNVLHIVGDGRTTITATYTSTNEDEITSSSNTKVVFVSDGNVCPVRLDEPDKLSLGAYGSTTTYEWEGLASEISFDIWKVTAATQEVTLTCYDRNNSKLGEFTYSSSSLSTSATHKTETLPNRTEKIVFKGTGSLNKYVSNVVVESKIYFEKITTDLGSVSGDNSANASINFKYSNVPTAISASLEGESTIAVSATPVGAGCGDWNDNASINLVFTPKTTGQRQYTYNGNVILSAGANEGLKTIAIPVNITIDMPYGTLNNGLAMLYKDEEIVLDTHTSAYWAEWNGDNTTLSIQAIDGKNVAAKMPVLLVGENNFYTFTVEENPTLTKEATNAFYYTTEPTTASGNDVFFVLGVKDGVAAFYKFTGEVPAGKVVLKMTKNDPMAAVPTRIDIELNEQTATALRPVYADEQADMNGQIFTIMGLPVSSMDQPGIYIMNGKKYIVR